MNSEFIFKSTECKPCKAIGKNLKPVIPARRFQQHKPCVKPNQEIRIDFGGPFFDENGYEIYFLAAIDRFSAKYPKYPTACIYEKANGPKVLIFLICISKIKEFTVLFVWIKQNVLLGIMYRPSAIEITLKLLKLQLTTVVLLVW